MKRLACAWVAAVAVLAGGAQAASGTFVIAGRIKGNWGFDWFIDGDRNCLRSSPKKTVCTHIYAHGDGGFMEVNGDGTVHTI